jgi:hypothetical protein
MVDGPPASSRGRLWLPFHDRAILHNYREIAVGITDQVDIR